LAFAALCAVAVLLELRGEESAYVVAFESRLNALCNATVGDARGSSVPSLDTDQYNFRKLLDSSVGECQSYITRMPPVGCCPVLAHTALWRRADTPEEEFELMSRKARIVALSFLATQQPGAQLWFWVPFKQDVLPMLQSLRLGGLAGAERVVVKHFEAIQVPDGTARSINMGEVLRSNRNKLLPAVLDVARYVLLDTYGGIWLDADVVVMRDLAPLQGLDFAYMLRAPRFRHDEIANNAILGVQSPRSPFMRQLLSQLVYRIHATEDSEDVYKWGPRLLSQLPPRTFHALPRCFFEPVGLDRGGHFFRHTSTTAKEDAILTDSSGSESKAPAFTYHWHNRWKVAIDNESAFAHHVQRLSRLLRKRTRPSLAQ